MAKSTKKTEEEQDNKELILAIEELEKEKGISKQYLLESIESALVKAYKQNFDSEDNVKIVMDENTGKIEVFSMKEVVDQMIDDYTQISLEDALKISNKYEIGDIVDVQIFPKEFGRISAQTAKQMVIQKIREAEREFIYTEFNDKIGEIISGIVQKSDSNAVVIDFGKLEGIMPTKEQVPTESYPVNSRVKAYVLDVQKGLKGTAQVVVSRSHPDFVRKLFELEIPEIYEGLIEVKAVSRDAGSRTKIAVYSKDPNIDPVGSCVGQKGTRIQNVINELSGEKIDVIEWNEDISIFISAALSPSEIMAVDINEEQHQALVVVPDNQLSLAIGKAGQNVRLAAKLTGWKIDIKSETQIRKQMEEQED